MNTKPPDTESKSLVVWVAAFSGNQFQDHNS